MNNEKTISFISDRKHYDIPESSILYISMNKQDAFIHTSDGSVLKTRIIGQDEAVEAVAYAQRKFYKNNPRVPCFSNGYPQRRQAYYSVKRRIAGICHAAPQGDIGEIPCETAFDHRFACRQRQSH